MHSRDGCPFVTLLRIKNNKKGHPGLSQTLCNIRINERQPKKFESEPFEQNSQTGKRNWETNQYRFWIISHSTYPIQKATLLGKKTLFNQIGTLKIPKTETIDKKIDITLNFQSKLYLWSVREIVTGFPQTHRKSLKPGWYQSFYRGKKIRKCDSYPASLPKCDGVSPNPSKIWGLHSLHQCDGLFPTSSSLQWWRVFPFVIGFDMFPKKSVDGFFLPWMGLTGFSLIAWVWRVFPYCMVMTGFSPIAWVWRVFHPVHWYDEFPPLMSFTGLSIKFLKSKSPWTGIFV